MTANATDRGKEEMDCARVAREEVLEGYLLGRLNKEDRDAFEEHYFECARCFDELRTLRAVQAALPRTQTEPDAKSRRPFGWGAVAAFASAAIVIITIGLAVALREQAPSVPMENTQLPTPSQPPSQPTASQSGATNRPATLTIEQLARVEPPPYTPLPLRGPLDEATQRFRRGMERYRKADYRSAIDELRTAQKLDPDAAHISFFLGVSQLMTGQDGAAIDTLRQAIALGDSAYLEEAHFYLAKAYLRRKDLDAAEAQLNHVIQLRGSEGEEARRLLAEIERLKK